MNEPVFESYPSDDGRFVTPKSIPHDFVLDAELEDLGYFVNLNGGTQGLTDEIIVAEPTPDEISIEPFFANTDNFDGIGEHNEQSVPNQRENRLKRFGRFALSRSTAWTEWIVGITAGNAIAETPVGRLGATALVVAGVYKLESIQAAKARDKEPPIITEPERVENIDKVSSNIIKRAAKKTVDVAVKTVKVVTRETFTLGSAAWQGAPATMNHNRAFGIKNTKKRGNFQSLVYGLAVGLWVSPLSYAETARNKAKNIGLEVIHNPIQAVMGSLAFAVALFLTYEMVEKLKENKKKSRE